MNLPLIVFFLAFAGMFILRVPIGMGMMMSAIFYFLLSANPAATIDMVAMQFLTNMNSSFILIAVPLFVFMAEIMNSSKVTNIIFDFASSIVGKKRGALAQVNVINSIIFSGMTGSAIADASGPGNMEMKAMKDAGYEDGFTCAITAASATEGPIIPPSIPMVFYSMLSGASVGALFMGGVVPGLILGFTMMGYVAVIAGPRNFPRGKSYPFKQFILLFLKSIPALLTVVVLLGGIYSGVVTPTEGRSPCGKLGAPHFRLFLPGLQMERNEGSAHQHGENHGDPLLPRRLGLRLFLHRGDSSTYRTRWRNSSWA